MFARDGTSTALTLPVDAYEFPRVSPDGTRLTVATNNGRDAIVWVYNLDGRADRRRLTVGGRNRFPIWSPDGRRIAFQSDRDGDKGIFWQAADGSGSAERLTKPDGGAEHIPLAFAGATLVFEVLSDNAYRLSSTSLAGRNATAVPGIQSASPITATISPDGKWLAYHTQEQGSTDAYARGSRDTVWVRPFPITPELYEVSSEGTSHHPVWSRDGGELLYIVGAAQVSARAITTKPTFALGKPRSLDSLLMPTQPPGAESRSFDVLADGRVISDAEPLLRPDSVTATSRSTEIAVVLNWLEELSAKMQRRQ